MKANLHPRYWPIWLFIGIVRLVVLLPFSWQLAFGRFLGRMGLLFAKRRRQITATNLRLCFPELSASAHKALLRKTFESLGMAGTETMMAWWMSERRFRKIPVRFEGWDNYLAAEASGQGVIVCGAHMTCLEIAGRHFGGIRPFTLVYQRHNNPVYENMMASRRQQYAKAIIPRLNVRAMVQALRNRQTLFYGPDQDFGPDRSVFAPFFNIPTATLKATAWLTGAGHAKLVPVLFNRTADNKGYEIHVHPAFEHYPSGDEVADATRLNQVFEAHIRRYPEQYLWAHRRFKTRPEGMGDVYSART